MAAWAVEPPASFSALTRDEGETGEATTQATASCQSHSILNFPIADPPPFRLRLGLCPLRVGVTRFPKLTLEEKQMKKKSKNGTANREKLRRELGEAYDRVLQWVADNVEVDPEDVRDPLHDVAKEVLGMSNPRIRKLDNYLTTSTVRAYRRSLGNGNKKIDTVLFSELSDDDLERVFEVPSKSPDPAEQAAANEILAIAKQEIAKMPERRRDVMRLHFAGLSNKEIGAALGMTPGTARSHIRHVRQYLVKKFGFTKEFSVARKRPRKPRTGRRAAKRRKAA
jgi:RNA polymerase sigma factor (sigma-70 family)